jgi:hypothetical protein
MEPGQIYFSIGPGIAAKPTLHTPTSTGPRSRSCIAFPPFCSTRSAATLHRDRPIKTAAAPIASLYSCRADERIAVPITIQLQTAQLLPIPRHLAETLSIVGSRVRNDQPPCTPLAIRSPISLSMLRQYSNARCSTGSDTPFLRCPTTLDTSRSRCASSITSRTMVPGWT